MKLKDVDSKRQNFIISVVLLLIPMIALACRFDYYYDLNDDVLMKEILSGNVAPYRAFLTKGGSESPVDELKHAGVDPTSDKVYDDSFTFFKEIMEEFKELLSR